MHTARYIPKGTFDVTLVGPEDEGFAPSLPNSVATNRVDDRLYINMVGNYDFNLGGGEMTVFAGVTNLFDTAPPLAPSSGIYTNPIWFDTIGRTYRAGLRVRY